MRVNYFDLGLHKNGWELGQIQDVIFPSLKINNYKIFGFEAHPIFYKNCKKIYTDDRVKLYNRAISNSEDEIKLFLARNTVGHSIFSTKVNVNKGRFIKVKGIVFSKFLEEEVSNFRDEVNILKINIEGAEWHFFNDIISKGYHEYFLFCGQGHDVDKVEELNSDTYWKLIEDYGIKLHRFSDFKKNKNADMKKLIEEVIQKRGANGFSDEIML
jgi:FkbM family methyltransferase